MARAARWGLWALAFLFTSRLDARSDISFNGPNKLAPIGAHSRYESLALGFFDDDLAIDLAVLGNPVQILCGNGDGTFQPPAAISPPSIVNEELSSLHASDFDGDGNADLVWLANPGSDSSTQPRIVVAYGNGQLGFTVGTLRSPRSQQGWRNLQIAVGDLNGDGWPDLVVTTALNSASAGVEVWLNAHGRGFTLQPALLNMSPIAYPTPGRGAPVIADFDGDGKADIVVSSGEFNSFFPPRLFYFKGNGDGAFQAPVVLTTGAPDLRALAAVDTNSDKNPDLLGAGGDGLAEILNHPAGKFASPLYFATGPGACCLGIADFDGDGRIDAAVGHSTAGAGSGVAVLPGSGSGWFGSPFRFEMEQRSADSLVVGDIDHDGKPDMVVAYGPLGGDAGVLAALMSTGTPVIRLRNLIVTPASAVCGGGVKVGVQITHKAPSGGLTVSLHSAHPALTLPATITVPANQTSMAIVVPAGQVSVETPGTVTASAGGLSVTRPLTIRPPGVSALILTPATVKGGGSVSAEVDIELPAGPGGLTVSLSSVKSGTAVFFPATITVSEGASSATFTIKTAAVRNVTVASIKATAKGRTKSAVLTITP